MISTNQSKRNSSLFEHTATIQTIVFVTIAIVIVMTLVSFIQIYSNKKSSVLKSMKTESLQLNSLISDNLHYSSNFIHIISKHIKSNPNDLNYIAQLLKAYSSSAQSNVVFGWRKFSWVDKNNQELVTSINGIIANPKKVSFTEEIKHAFKTQRHNLPFYKRANDNSLKIITPVFDGADYHGSIVLSYDINNLVRNLNMKKKHQSANFVILDQNLKIVAQSNLFIQNIMNQNSELTEHLNTNLKKIPHNLDQYSQYSYLDMFNGLNYHITQISNLPFILVLNIDSDIIKKDILQDLITNITIVCIFTILSLIAIIFIYRRETSLREKIEKASLIATYAAKARTNFLAFTAHEIRSPLGFILTGSEMMTKELIGKLPEDYKKYANGINQSAREILEFINGILDENQIIEGKFKITNEFHKINEIIQDAIDTNLTRFDKRNIKIHTILCNEMPLLLCDKQRLYQILNNLISNSIKYSDDNTNIEIKTILHNSEFIISVRDEGYGMNEDEIPLALSPYCTIHGADKFYSSSSYGLGLSIVKMLAEAHDAELRISSVKGKGTTVKIIFPKHKLVYDSPLSNKNKKIRADNKNTADKSN